MWQFRNEVDDLLKTSKASTAEEFLKMREENRMRLDESELRTHK
jgi:hypothetical protein